MFKLIHSFERNPRTQLRFHAFMTAFWLVSMAVVPFIIHPHDTASLVALVILEVSLYANFATDYGAMSAAIAAIHTQPTNKELSDQISDLPVNHTP